MDGQSTFRLPFHHQEIAGKNHRCVKGRPRYYGKETGRVERERLMEREQVARRIAEEASRVKDDFLAQLSLMNCAILLMR